MEALAEKEAEFRAQCDAGDVRGCHSLAELMQLVRRDAAGALTMFRGLCSPPRAYGPSCFAAASLLLPDPEAAVFFERACDAGSAEGCANLAVLCQRGESGADPARAVAFADRACALGEAKSCFFAAAARRSQDPRAALQVLSAGGCVLLRCVHSRTGL